MDIPRGSPVQITLSVQQQNFDPEWNSERQIIVTDIFLIMQSLSEALIQGKCIKTQL